MPKSYGELVRSYREEAGLTQEELAALSGLGVRTISDIERGRTARPHPSSAERLSRALGREDLAHARSMRDGLAGPAPSWDLLSVPAMPQVRYSLPADTAAFTGRAGELGQITAAVTGSETGRVVVAAIDGMPGVGKTALAVHAAHVLAGKFPDRQLFVDLHAHTPGREPVTAADALASLLAAVGVDPRFVPVDLEERAGMWRDRMAGQRALLVFDNAASSGQVIPLLPGAGGCLVLVTSRRHLGDLPGMVTAVLADVLAPQEAAGMFVQLAPRAEADRERVAEVVRLAGFLPLAISLLARVLVRHPAWTVADLAAEMRDGVLALAAESDSIAAMFEVSYRGLDPDSRRLFQLLGMHPGTTFDGFAAAALAGIRSSESAGLLDSLHKEGLLTEAGYRWYGMHDLIRWYARDLVAGDTVGVDRALGSLLDYYQSAAALAGTRLARQARPGAGAAARTWFEIPVLRDASQALAWARANRASLIACLELATRTGQHARTVALTAGLATLLRSDGPWAEAVTRHAAAVDAARQLGDRLGEANALADLAEMQQMTGDHAGAAEIFAKTLDLYRALGDRLGEANALASLGIARRMIDDYAGAAGVLEQALAIYRELGDKLGEANALHNLGRVSHDYPAATASFEEALRIYRDLGDRLGEANALSNLGAARQMTGNYLGAAEAVEEALDIYRHLGSRFGEANALHNLGTVRQTTGDYLGAAQAVEEALRIYRDLGSRVGEANTLHNLGAVRRMRGDYAGATSVLQEALSVYREIGLRIGEAHSLRELGTVRNLCGDHSGAAAVLDEALSIYHDIDHHQGLAETLNEQGILHLARDDHAEARGCHEQALQLASELGSSRDEASALAGLGRAAKAAGSDPDAEHLLRQAYQIFQRTGAAEAAEIRAELDALARPG